VKHFVQKGRITPVLKDVHDWVTVDYWKNATDRDASYFERPIPPGYVAPVDDTGRSSPIKPMMGKIAFPGDQMDSILNGSANVFKRSRRGVVELKTLKGHDYEPQSLGNGVVTDKTIWEIQKAIFPDYPFLPVLLDETEKILIAAQIHSSLRSITDEMLVSLNQFRDYARATIEEKHFNMRETARSSEAGYVPRYSGVDFVLLEQLGLSRQDINIRNEAKPSSDSELREMFKAFIVASKEEKEAMAAMYKAQTPIFEPVGETGVPADFPNERTMMANPMEGYSGYGGQSGYSGFSGEITNATPEGQEEMAVAMADVEEKFTCVCGRDDFKSARSLQIHQTVHCEVAKAQ
jgi:hypothetical protein